MTLKKFQCVLRLSCLIYILGIKRCISQIVQVRVAQGLAREGWNITKNLFSEITVLTCGFFLGVLQAEVQDFCLLAVMGLLADFYLQTFFFVTILSIDIGRSELVDVLHHDHRRSSQHLR